MEVSQNPLCSPYLPPSDLFMFDPLNKHSEITHFHNEDEIVDAILLNVSKTCRTNLVCNVELYRRVGRYLLADHTADRYQNTLLNTRKQKYTYAQLRRALQMTTSINTHVV